MPYEDKNTSNSWKIIYINCVEPPGANGAMVKFEVIPPDGTSRLIKVVFSFEFIEDYYEIPGDNGIVVNRIKIINEKEEMLKLWGIIKIEECINNDSLKEPPKRITNDDREWAKKVEKEIIKPSSSSQDNKTYIFITQRKIGF